MFVHFRPRRRTSKMTQFSILIVVVLIWNHHDTEAVECSIPSIHKSRVFDSMVHYQSNHIPFNPVKGDWQGSTVEFSFKSFDKLQKNAFVTYDSEYVISLKLSDKQIKQVDEGAFISLLCLHELFLDHNNITELTRNVFQTLQKLQKLDLSYNKLEVVKDLAFSDLPRLKSLNLEGNKITKLEVLAFTKLTSLEDLNLERNQISGVLKDVFRPLLSLTHLTLSWNKLRDIEPEKWGGLTKLQNLELAGNHLDHFDPSYNFSFFALKSLNLSFNSLTGLNAVEIRRHFPQLELIALNDNPWFCDDLDGIIRELNDSKIKFSSGNFSSVGSHGIACSEVPKLITSTTISTSTKRTEEWMSKEQVERYVKKKIEDNNEELKGSIKSLNTFIIFVFSLLCVFIVFEVLLRTNVCRVLINKLKGGNELYVDDGTDIENFRLLHR